MSKSKRDLTGEEKRLWRRVAASVKTRRSLPAEGPTEEVVKPLARVAAIVKRAPPAPPVKRAPPPPADRGAEKRVRRGKLDIGGKLDLHGHNQETAPAALERFLHAARGRGETTVIVITGVGRAGEGILKRRLPEWLDSRALRPIVSGYAQAHRTHGGAGAFYVFLKRARETQT